MNGTLTPGVRELTESIVAGRLTEVPTAEHLDELMPTQEDLVKALRRACEWLGDWNGYPSLVVQEVVWKWHPFDEARASWEVTALQAELLICWDHVRLVHRVKDGDLDPEDTSVLEE